MKSNEIMSCIKNLAQDDKIAKEYYDYWYGELKNEHPTKFQRLNRILEAQNFGHAVEILHYLYDIYPYHN